MSTKEKLNVLLVGSGGRENAIAWKLKQSSLVDNLFVAPGNGGTGLNNIPIDANDVGALVSFAKEKKCFTIVGPEGPLKLGLMDRLSDENLRSYGPSQAQARLETSKTFAKETIKEIGIPTAPFVAFNDYGHSLDYVRKRGGDVVVKADGLAGGKGVYVCSTLEEAESALKSIFIDRVFGTSGDSVLIEDKLTGYEVSLMAVCTGRNALQFGTATDHKRLLDRDKGPNTGGMGAFSPALKFGDEDVENAMESIVLPIVRKTGYRGFLYTGLMITEEGPKVLEFNARLGDPETQCILPRLKSDFLKHIVEAYDGNDSSPNSVTWDPSYSCCVVMCSRGYPSNTQTGFPIRGLEKAKQVKGSIIFHSGTKFDNGNYVTTGGRVLCVDALGKSLEDASDLAYSVVKLISWEGENHRNDIGRSR
jgi:phosphoribosylamine--glycine ligase